jgi:cyclic beta-1,2-glucan synthetase
LAHTRRASGLARYKVEPYVIVADIYGARPHVGRGGWTWYTGSAGLGYRIGLESILGLRVVDGRVLELRPCVPDHWPHYEIDYRAPGSESCYLIRIRNPDSCSESVVAASVDGTALEVRDGILRLELRRDGERHQVTVTLGRRGQPPA